MDYLFDKLNSYPIIAAVHNLEDLNMALESPCLIIFLLNGNIFNLKEISNKANRKGKYLFVNIDSIDGFSKDTWGLEYIIKKIQPDGIITNKSNLVKLSKDMGMYTILRLPIYDSLSLDRGISSISNCKPHAVEILPGIIPKIISKVFSLVEIPIITSGLIMDIEDINNSLKSGAMAISTDIHPLWYDYKKGP